MTATKNLLAGLGGAIALNLLHESLKRLNGDMPRIDKLGEEALQKALDKIGLPAPEGNNLYLATLGADVVSNALYYSAIGVGDPKHLWARAIGLGITAGTGAVTLPEEMGLDATPVVKTTMTKSLTIGYYLFGALVTAGILKAMGSRD